MIKIREEVDEIASGKYPRDDNVLKNAPHPVALMTLSEEDWNRPYSKEKAAYALPYLRKTKFWPTVTRIDDGEFGFIFLPAQSFADVDFTVSAYGDTHLICSCDSVEDYAGTSDAKLKISGGVTSNT